MASATDLAKKANEQFVDDNFEYAVELYTQAIVIDPIKADLFADRAQANIKLGNFTEAVADANKAIELDSKMAKAYFRKGIACIKLEEYQTAKASLQLGASLAPGDARFAKLIKQCDTSLAEELGTLNVTSDDLQSSMPLPPSSNVSIQSAKNVESINEVPAQIIPVAKPKYRHDHYNSGTTVVLTIFAKNISPSNVVVDFGEQILSITIDVPGEEEYHFQPRLFGKIIPEKCTYQVLSTKIEIRLAKPDTTTWTSLEFNKESTLSVRNVNVPSAPSSQRPSYPSSKSNVDWDKLEAQVKKEEKEEKLDGDAALNKMFRDIYKDADEDTRRAMSKSFLESNGTVLSTNWSDVGKKKVDGSPPDGMELKKWEY
ncbi:hypothetical protein ZOSMA_5G00470 [Zostera marina]|uniref:Protein SGT1 homolog n=1 Tax=Zostera marina TaxID=29655 RepID=A0A0K9NW56_ZOSMR|nr:hypothetical protein ZOSMA_5G00470 [Zostera marina]